MLDQIPEYIISAVVTGIITGFISIGYSHFMLKPRIVELETKMEPLWKTLKNGYSTAVLGNPTSKKRVKELLEKHETNSLNYEEAQELKSKVEKCFESAKEKNDYSSLTYLTLLIGTLDVRIENLKKKGGSL